MEPYYLDAACSIFQGDSLAVLPTFEPDSVDGILTDPPYGLGFMGKAWDHGVPSPEFWREALRVAKPGAYLLAFGGTRTFHRLACAIEDPPRPLIRGGVAGTLSKTSHERATR